MKIDYLQSRVVAILTITMTAFFLLLSSNGHGSKTGQVDEAVQHLIAHVAESDLTFIRNNDQFTGKEAADHMQKKYVYFRDKIKTPEDFIELCATRSLMSGKPYLVINEKGAIITANEWLRTELVAYQNGIIGKTP